MQGNEFEEAFGQFLEQEEYDNASSALFSLARAAFQAGWLAAGGTPHESVRFFEILRSDPSSEEP